MTQNEPSEEELKRRLDFEIIEVRMRILIKVFDFSFQQRLILELLVDRTFARWRERALIPSLDHVVRFTRILRGDVSLVLRDLEDRHGIIGSGPAPEWKSRHYQDPRWYWLLVEPREWKEIGPRIDRQYHAQLHQELDFLESQQPRLILPTGNELVPAEMPGLKAEIATSTWQDALHEERQGRGVIRSPFYRARLALDATDARNVCGISEHVGVRKNRTHTEFPNTSPTYEVFPHASSLSTNAGVTRTREHEHVHGTPRRTKHVEHAEHARGVEEVEEFDPALNELSISELADQLEEEAAFWYLQLQELCPDLTPTYRKTWLLRLSDRWREAAFKAIAETKRMKIEGKPFSKGAGQTANFYFHHFKNAARKVARKS